jgi:heme-degrading monooxygenase HmoA
VSPITVINPFEVPDQRRDDALELWDRANAFFEGQEGFLSARLYEALDGTARFRFVTVAEWESAEAFVAALGSDELQALERELAEFPHSPGAYAVVRGG